MIFPSSGIASCSRHILQRKFSGDLPRTSGVVSPHTPVPPRGATRDMTSCPLVFKSTFPDMQEGDESPGHTVAA
jgi:hypothetical protein